MKTTFWVWRDAGFYFRVFGYGFSAARDRRVYFSERYGYRKVYRIGRWSFEFLTRKGLPS